MYFDLGINFLQNVSNFNSLSNSLNSLSFLFVVFNEFLKYTIFVHFLLCRKNISRLCYYISIIIPITLHMAF